MEKTLAGAEARLADILDGYLADLAAGTAMPREELLARYPDLADDLDACLTSLGFIRQAGKQAAAADTPVNSSPTAPVPETLGDYRIVREVGRGGMGIVYEAEQLGLGRRVALKVLPFAAALDPRHLQRFKNEALAAAQLHHPHIVPVHAIGCERGTHYYVMQFIDGPSLAGVIDELRRHEWRVARSEGRVKSEDTDRSPLLNTPHSPLATRHSPLTPGRDFFRTVARLGVQAADALEQAHQLGIVHRDVKPANLLVDGRGHLYVTDFGLAQFQSESGLTRTGDLIGTLRYMSPEQAGGGHGLTDARADVYALGATLYELATHRPLFDGRDRQELLRQIATDEPVPPRRLCKAMPAELETIILKAVAKHWPERYATAQALADDLRRFLEDRPIIARRPTLIDRTRKWARRHRTLVGAGAATLLIVLMVLAASSVVFLRQRDNAEARHRQARRAVDEMYTAFAQRWWSRQPHAEPLRREFLLKALGFYREFAGEDGSDPQSRLEAARASRRVGEIQQQLGDLDAAAGAFTEALVRLDALPLSAECREEQAHCHNGRAHLLRTLGRLGDAAAAYERAQTLFARLANEDPDNADFREGLAGCGNNRGVLLHALGKRQEAQECLNRAGEQFDALQKQRPESASIRHAAADCRHNLGNLYRDTKRRNEARAAYEQAIALRQTLLTQFPGVPAFRQSQAASYYSLGRLLMAERRFPEAEQALRQALQLRTRLVEDYPLAPAYRQALAASHHSFGVLYTAAGNRPEAEMAYRQALALHRELAAAHPQVPVYREQLAETMSQLANLGRDKP